MRIGIIGAMDEELIPIREFVSGLEVIEQARRVFWHGTAFGKEIVLTRCDPGKVNAVISTQHMIDLFSVDAVFNMGSSGALDPRLAVGDLVIASEFIQHDFDVTGWGLKPGEMMFDVVMSGDDGQMHFRTQQIFTSHPGLQQLAFQVAEQTELKPLGERMPRVYNGRLLSGDQFIGSPEKARGLWETLQGMCVDMEAAAIAQTCELNRVPFLCIRAISDKADHSAMLSFADFLVGATANYGRIFKRVLERAHEAL